MFVLDEGQGCPVFLLLHGFSGSVRWFDAVAPLLAAHGRVLRVDLLGHGRTGGHDGLDAESQAAAVCVVLDERGIERVTAIGHSYGADVALALGPRVDKLVIIGQAPDYSYATFPTGSRLLAAPVLGPLLHRLAPPSAVRKATSYAFAPGFDFDPVLLRDHAATCPAVARAVLVDRREALARRPLDERVRDLGVPTLVVLGRHDRFYDCARTAERYRAVGARAEIIEAAGHSPQIEAPAKIVDLVLSL
ncbi:alpha/beta fold hydrolase [Kutzneria buriramensis]|uniref:Pimeloyl-ACP methyl ester carboxylesterase n=1 Tax=Kutzneria buriramensis TaxID=1045776 RepID=A0A3E0H1A6_9PSEU|nr:alpha/beta hydrolase [Kutzneria buriramensis]REH36306.1 pimeloyl-ACP methyl ester carboxylesterase [Kutzneria buriramensis]